MVVWRVSRHARIEGISSPVARGELRTSGRTKLKLELEGVRDRDGNHYFEHDRCQEKYERLRKRMYLQRRSSVQSCIEYIGSPDEYPFILANCIMKNEKRKEKKEGLYSKTG